MAAEIERLNVRFDSQTRAMVKYWAAKKNITESDFVKEAVHTAIAFENRDYPLPTLEQARLNMLVDLIKELTVTVGNLSSEVHTGLASMIALTRGRDYFSDEEDGELRDVEPLEDMGGSQL